MYTMNEIKELMAMGFTAEQITQMTQSSETPQVATAKAVDTPQKPVVINPWDTVLCNEKFEIIWHDKKHEIEIQGDLYKGFKKALRTANTVALKNGYKTVKGCKTGWKFEDGKEYYDAKEHFEFVRTLTVRVFQGVIEYDNNKLLREVEQNEKWFDEVKKQYNVK